MMIEALLRMLNKTRNVLMRKKIVMSSSSAIERSWRMMCWIIRTGMNRWIRQWKLMMSTRWTPWAIIIIVVSNDRCIFGWCRFVDWICSVIAVAISWSWAHQRCTYKAIWRFRQLNVVVVIASKLINWIWTLIAIVTRVLCWRISSNGIVICSNCTWRMIVMVIWSARVMNWIRYWRCCVNIIIGWFGWWLPSLISHLMNMRWIKIVHWKKLKIILIWIGFLKFKSLLILTLCGWRIKLRIERLQEGITRRTSRISQRIWVHRWVARRWWNNDLLA